MRYLRARFRAVSLNRRRAGASTPSVTAALELLYIPLPKLAALVLMTLLWSRIGVPKLLMPPPCHCDVTSSASNDT